MIICLITQLKDLVPYNQAQDPILMLHLWQYIAIFLIFFGTRLLILFIARLLLSLLPTKRVLYTVIQNTYKHHSYTLAMLLCIQLLGDLDLPATSSLLNMLISALHLGCSILLVFLAYSITDGLFLHLQKSIDVHSKKHIYLLPFFKKITKITIAIFSIILLPRFFIIYDITSLLGHLSLSIGLVTTALALALKDTIHNLIGGITIIIDDLLHTGDSIKIDGIEGTVVHMDVRTTIIKTPSGSKVHIPNAIFTNKNLMNSGQVIKKSLKMQVVDKNVTISHIENLLKDFNKLIQTYPEAIANKCKVQLDEIKDDTLNISFDLVFTPISEKQIVLYICQIVSDLKKLIPNANITLKN